MTHPVFILWIALLIGFPLWAHERHHDTQTGMQEPIAAKAASVRINEAYLYNGKPIFQAKCFDCHSALTRYPWYYRLPGAKQLIDRDIREAKKHLDMTRDFPFEGHGTPAEDLEAIAETVKKSTMPPWRYRIMHRGSALTDSERRIILQWIQEANGGR